MCTKNIQLFTDKDQKEEIKWDGLWKNYKDNLIFLSPIMDVQYKMILVDLIWPTWQEGEPVNLTTFSAFKYFQGLESQQVSQSKSGTDTFSSLITSNMK